MILVVILVARQKKESKENNSGNKLESRRNLNNKCKKPIKKKSKIRKRKHHQFFRHLLLQMQLKQHHFKNLCSNLTKKPQLLCLSQSSDLLRNQDNHRESVQSKSLSHNRCNETRYLTLCQTIVQIGILHLMKDERRSLKYNKTLMWKKRRNQNLSGEKHHCLSQELHRCDQARL